MRRRIQFLLVVLIWVTAASSVPAASPEGEITSMDMTCDYPYSWRLVDDPDWLESVLCQINEGSEPTPDTGDSNWTNSQFIFEQGLEDLLWTVFDAISPRPAITASLSTELRESIGLTVAGSQAP